MSAGRIGIAALVVLAAVAAAGTRARAASNVDPTDAGRRYAWGENVGWINARPSGPGGPGMQVGDGVLTGWLWGENIGWISLSCLNEAVCDASPYGVTNDGFGRLSGFAWGENVGWINFGPTTCAVDPTCGVRIDPASGYFFGRAWGENIGWITFASGPPREWTVQTTWCQATAAPPGEGFALSVDRSGPGVVLSWTALDGAGWYDVAAGDLGALDASGGDFAAAGARCIGSRVSGLVSDQPQVPGKPGGGSWFLVRGANCKGHGSYGDATASPPGGRDAGIVLSQRDCP